MNGVPPEIADKAARLFVVAFTPMLLIVVAIFTYRWWASVQKRQR